MTERDQLAQLLRDAASTVEVEWESGLVTLKPSIERVADFLLSKGVRLSLSSETEGAPVAVANCAQCGGLGACGEVDGVDSGTVLRCFECNKETIVALMTPEQYGVWATRLSGSSLLPHREGEPSEAVPIPVTVKQLRDAMAHIEHNTPAATEWTDIQVMLEAVARWVESDGQYPRTVPPPVTVDRCPTHHYMSGWCCQLPANHTGPCLANAGINGEEWTLGAGRRAVYAWHQPPGQPACAQRPCENPNKCACAVPLPSSGKEEETP